MKVLSSAQMRDVDRLTTERYGIPGLQLMENASIALIENTEKKYGSAKGKQILIVAGRGNNGGDGAAAARQFHVRGAVITLVVLGRINDSKGDARRNLELARSISDGQPDSFRVLEIDTPEQFKDAVDPVHFEWLVDAIFGTGLTRPAGGIYEIAIEYLNETRRRSESPVVSVDIPSGISSDSHELIGPAVQADLTVTFTAPKLASVLPPACHYGGDLVVAPIGSPPALIAEAGARLNLVESINIANWLASSRRGPDANKGDVGKVLIVAGSRGKTGAACLSGGAAIRSGTGLVTVATAESAQPAVASQIAIECMTEPLPETEQGTVSSQAASRVFQLADERDVLAIGPGIGSSEEATRELVHTITAGRRWPVVIDADGLNSLAPWGDELKGTAELPIVLTPHPGEMARLTGRPIPYVLRGRVEVARDFAVRNCVVLVLKGSRTVVAAPDGEVYVNPTGNSGMATGGTGDVLTGITAGLLAQKPKDPVGATIAAVYLHGLAGDIAASRVGARALIASDITAHLGDAFLQAGGEAERLIQ
jgi:ADP-dependent NAD(P)H-hydrate dehydratase / NAD(P)H-hydrate epimerase